MLSTAKSAKVIFSQVVQFYAHRQIILGVNNVRTNIRV